MRGGLKKLMIFASVTIGMANVFAVWSFWKFVKETELRGGIQFDFSQYLAVQSHQNSMLQVYLVIFTILLGFLAFYGFSQIKEGAEKAASKKAEEISKTMVENFLTNSKNLHLGNPSFPYTKESEIEKSGGPHV